MSTPTWHLVHLAALFFWAGLVVCETVVEFSPLPLATRASLHWWIDAFVELPVLALIILSGTVLVSRLPELTPLHWVKIACAAIAIGANLACAGAVRLRYRNAATPVGAKYDHWVKRAWVGVPFGLAALYIGLTHFHEWP